MMAPSLLADRRLSIGLMLMDEGDTAGAASVFEQVVELEPHWLEACFALADAMEASGQREQAITRFRHCLTLDPSDPLGAEARLAVLAAVATPTHLPQAYVRTLFNQYASRFDAALLGRLGYSAPARLRAALDMLCPEPGQTVLDLGCGTGLAGVALRDRVSRLDGVDLSPEMIRQAELKGVYDRLVVSELMTFLAGVPATDAGDGRQEAVPQRYDLVVAADVVPYLGDLTPLVAAVAGRLHPGGLFAFTGQRAEEPDDGSGACARDVPAVGAVSLTGERPAPYHLGADCRFAHPLSYLRACAAAAVMIVRELAAVSCRTEAGRPVPGFLAVFERPAICPDSLSESD